MPITRTCPRCSNEISAPISLIPLPAPYELTCPRCLGAIPTALAERAAWMKVQLWKLVFVIIAISGFRHYGLKRIGSALLVMIVAGGLFGFLASVLLGWLAQVGIDFIYFGLLGHEDREGIAPGSEMKLSLAPPKEAASGSASIPPADGSPAALHRQAVQADHGGDKALAWLLYRRFFQAPAGDLAALRLPLAEAEKRFEVLGAELATWSPDTWVSAGSRLGNEGRSEEAVICLERALEADPKHAGAWSLKAVQAWKRGQAAIAGASYGGGKPSDANVHFEEAVRCFDKSLAAAPDKIGSWETRGMALFFLKRIDEADESFAHARALKPKGERYLAVSEDGNAIVSCAPDEDEDAAHPAQHERASEPHDEPRGETASLDPVKARVVEQLHRASELEKGGHAEDAVQALEHFLDASDDLPDGLVNEVKHQLASLRLRRARSHALPASLGLETEALDLGREGRLEEALQVFEQAVKADPRNAGAWSNRANALSELGRHEEALHSAETALKIAPRAADTWSNKGRALAELGRRSEALACFEKALSIDPKHAMSWYNRGVSLLKEEHTAEALRSFEKTLELEPGHALARRAYTLVLKDLAKQASP
jgi:tetratricopeptide (TPR) repeat protein